MNTIINNICIENVSLVVCIHYSLPSTLICQIFDVQSHYFGDKVMKALFEI